MKKNKLVICGVLTIFTLCVFGGLFYLKQKDNSNLEAKTTTVKDLNTSVNLDTSDEKIEWANYEKIEISLSKSITITDGGIYNLSGKISDGLIMINTEKDVNVVLNNVDITNNKGPAIYVENANQVVITLADGSINTLRDGSKYSNYDTDVEGTIYSKDDLIFEGSGKLIIKGNKGDGIVCKDDLKFNSGIYEISSKDDGVRGKDSIYILNGEFTIDALGDGMKSTNDTDNEKGYIKIDNGVFNIVASLDGLQAETKVLITDGTFTIKTGGGSSNSSDKSEWGHWGGASDSTTISSAKGVKAINNIVIANGNFTFDTSDDAIHSNSYVGISGGIFNISSGDDGIHADKELVVDGGKVIISKSYEGLEAETITVNGGEFDVVSSDDGINVAGGNDGSAYGRPGGAPYGSSSANSTLTINGGKINVNASGDGLDANGTIYINGGEVIVNGPTSSMNGTLDYDRECIVNGGALIGIGSSGMAQGISNSSKQYGIMVNFSKSYSSGQKVTIENSNGKDVLNYTAKKAFSNVVFSSSLLSKGTYTIKVDGSVYDTFEIKSIFTTIGSRSGYGGGPYGR